MSTRLLYGGLIAAGLYVGAVAVLYAAQDRLLYRPVAGAGDAARGMPAGFRLERIATAHGDLVTWRHDGDPRLPTIVYFHGNAATLAVSAGRLARLAAAGHSVRALEYRGFAGVAGQPTQAGLTEDAVALVRGAVATAGPGGVAVYGWSLGSAVAIAAAALADVAVRGLVLETPAAALVDVAAERFPVFPVRWLMRDTWVGRDHASRLALPVLILHGDNDRTIPDHHGRGLAAAFAGSVTFVGFPGGGHADLDRFGAVERIVGFLAALPPL